MSKDKFAELKKQGITDRELDVIEHLLKGKNNLDISQSLFLSDKTVKFHLTSIYKKLKVKNRIQCFIKVTELIS